MIFEKPSKNTPKAASPSEGLNNKNLRIRYLRLVVINVNKKNSKQCAQ